MKDDLVLGTLKPTAEAGHDRRSKELLSEIQRLQEQVVFGFYEEEYPLFQQGYARGVNELSSPVTAEECTDYIKKIKDLKSEVFALNAQVEGLAQRAERRLSEKQKLEQEVSELKASIDRVRRIGERLLTEDQKALVTEFAQISLASDKANIRSRAMETALREHHRIQMEYPQDVFLKQPSGEYLVVEAQYQDSPLFRRTEHALEFVEPEEEIIST